MESIEQLPQQVEPIIRKAGELLLRYFGTSFEVQIKPDNSSVTQADIESEQLLMRELGALLPEAAFCTEESGSKGDGRYQWVIDPLDGTNNFTHGLPHFCVSVALTDQGAPVFGMIYQPITNELFYAIKGHGSYLNGTRLTGNNGVKTNGNMLIFGFSLPKKEQPEMWQSLIKLKEIASFRFLGAAALDLAFLACGRVDALYFRGLSWWDVAAGGLIAQEAGLLVSGCDGSALSADTCNCLLGARQGLHTQMKESLVSC